MPCAVTVMLKGNNANGAITTFLTANGHTVFAKSNVYTGVDAVVLLRTKGDAALTNFVLGGGTLVTEWTGADWAMSNLLGGFVSGGAFVGTNTPVTFSAAGIAAGLSNGAGAGYTVGPASEFFRNFGSLGTGSVFATRPGSIAAIVGGSRGVRLVVANGNDWADSFNASQANGQGVAEFDRRRSGRRRPEPATWATLILGMGVIGGVMRRANRAVTASFA